MKKIVCFIICFLFLCPIVFAQESDTYISVYQQSGAEDLEETLDEEIREMIEELEIDLEDYNSFLALDYSSLLNLLKSIFQKSILGPISIFTVSIGVILCLSVMVSFWNVKSDLTSVYQYISFLIIASVVIIPLVNAFESCVGVIKSLSAFMVSFIPIFCGVLISTGAFSTSALYSGLMLLFSQGVNYIAAFGITPIITIYLCLGFSSAISENEGVYSIALGLKTIVNWVMVFISTLFTGVLSIQNIIGKAADSLTLKTTRFFVGSFVPVVGNALSEALSTVTASFSVLRSTLCGWCMVVIALFILPFIIELFCWRIMLSGLSSVSKMFSQNSLAKLFEVCGVSVGFLIGIFLIVSIMYILSLVIIQIG